jgi:Flp pilus assembly protein TadG
MSWPLLSILRRLRRDERGNIFVLFGACAVPLLLVMGGAVDLTRYNRYKAQLSAAVDSASLALSRKHRDYSITQADE